MCVAPLKFCYTIKGTNRKAKHVHINYIENFHPRLIVFLKVGLFSDFYLQGKGEKKENEENCQTDGETDQHDVGAKFSLVCRIGGTRDGPTDGLKKKATISHVRKRYFVTFGVKNGIRTFALNITTEARE